MIINSAHDKLILGSHCFSTAITRITREFFDPTYEEEDCFGLGLGLGFMYRRENHLITLSGRANDIEKYFMDSIGGSMKQFSFSTFEEFIEASVEYLKNGYWLLLYTDASHLSYIDLGLTMKDIGMMSEHACILYGLDISKKEAYVYDYMKKDGIVVPFEELRRALYNDAPEQFSDERTACLKNTFSVFDFPNIRKEDDLAVYDAILDNCLLYMNPTNKYQGMVGFSYFEKEFPLWPELMTEDLLLDELTAAYSYMDRIGTGGGNFRRLYARFLASAGKRIKDERLTEMSKSLFNLARSWKEFSLSLEALSRHFDKDKYGLQVNALKEIGKREKEMLNSLQVIVKEG